MVYVVQMKKDEMCTFKALVYARHFIISYGRKSKKYPILKNMRTVGYVFFDNGIWGYYDCEKQKYYEVNKNGSITNGSYYQERRV